MTLKKEDPVRENLAHPARPSPLGSFKEERTLARCQVPFLLFRCYDLHSAVTTPLHSAVMKSLRLAALTSLAFHLTSNGVYADSEPDPPNHATSTVPYNLPATAKYDYSEVLHKVLPPSWVCAIEPCLGIDIFFLRGVVK